MTRIEVLNAIIEKKNVKNYLEIGVNRGKCLFNIRGGERRFAVDPFFNFNVWKKIKAIAKNSDNLKNEYFEVTSDIFFESNLNLLQENKIDLAFIDGLHTYKQCLTDVLNTLKYLGDSGIIVLHDCNPLDELAAFPATSIDDARSQLKDHPGWKNIWNGDVWKVIVYIRKNHPELSAFVLDTDHGLGFVYKKQRKQLPGFFEVLENIDELGYEFFDKNRTELIDLKPISFFSEFLETI